MVRLWFTTALLAAAVYLPAQTFDTANPAFLPQPTAFHSPEFEHTIRMEEDKNGFAWLATNRGLFCFDGTFFRKITHTKNGGFSALDAGQINDLFLDREKEQLWLATQAGASLLDLRTETFTDHVFYEKGKPNITDGECTAVFIDRQGVVWFGVQGLGLVSFDKEFRYFTNTQKKPGSFTGIYQIAQDASTDSILWLATGTGLARFNKATGTYFFTDRKPPDGHEVSLILTALFPTKDKIFLGSTWRHGGIIYDIPTGKFKNLEVKNPRFSGVELKLGNFQPRSTNTIWGFTDEGIVVIDVNGDSLLAAFRNPSISSETRNCTALPKHIWAGAHGGLLRYDFTTYTVENHRIQQDANRRPEILWSALEQGPGGKKLWLTFVFSDFIYDYDRANRAFKTIPKYPGTRAAPAWLLRLHDGRILATGDGGIFELRDNRLLDLHLLREIISAKEQISQPFQDRKGRVWLTSRFAGFYEIDLKTGAWRDALAGKKFWAAPLAFMDGRENFWLSGNGFSIYKPLTDSLLHFPYRPSERLTSHHPRGYEEDEDGNIWLSDIRVGGLMKVDTRHLEKGIVERYDAPGGGQRNLMRALKKDRRGRIWAVTEAGLQVFDPRAKMFRLFGEAAGFQLMSDVGAVSNLSSNLTLLSTGEILVGYKNGFAIFHPDSLTENRELPKPYLLAVSANEKPLTAGVSFRSGQPLRLTHSQNVLEFEFSSLAFYEPKKIRYRYRLVGFDEDWAETSRRFLRYTHLPPGNYTFQLQALNSDGFHSAQPLEWRFRILVPWWATWWAYLAYLMLAAAAAYAFYFYKKRQWQMQAALEIEHLEAERLKDLDAVKTRLYTNITHEFRTPLTIILGMVKQIKANPKDWYSEGLQMIERNGQNLLSLVGQMLDMSKLESGKLELHQQRGNLVVFLKYLAESLQSLAESKRIHLHFLADDDEIVMDFDAERLQQVVMNLLSNAIKFTTEDGQVYFSVRKDLSSLVLTVQDTGVGIPAEKLPFIFDRFYQVDDTATRQGEGTGIGLALTKELVKLMDGEINVKSTPSHGTTFRVVLPITNNAKLEWSKNDMPPYTAMDGTPTAVHTQKNIAPIPSESQTSATEKPMILIADDNADVIAYLTACLANEYQLAVAHDGQACVNTALELIPDLVVADVMMPNMDGYLVCETLKKDERTSHIPIILLTAKADMGSRLEGLGKGADAYMAKPFHQEELLLRIKKLLELRVSLQRHYLSVAGLGIHEPVSPDQPKANVLEDYFIKKVRKVVEAHLDDFDFTVERLCHEIGISHSQLHRKLSAVTGLPAIKFIRAIRLSKAKGLLMHPETTITSVAFDTGFNDLSYFGKVFKQEFGMTPNEWREKQSTPYSIDERI